ncbi:hypothetical protein Dimus_010518 [Dionaea muscipula]
MIYPLHSPFGSCNHRYRELLSFISLFLSLCNLLHVELHALHPGVDLSTSRGLDLGSILEGEDLAGGSSVEGSISDGMVSDSSIKMVPDLIVVADDGFQDASDQVVGAQTEGVGSVENGSYTHGEAQNNTAHREFIDDVEFAGGWLGVEELVAWLGGNGGLATAAALLSVDPTVVVGKDGDDDGREAVRMIMGCGQFV